MADLRNRKIIYTFDSWRDYDDLMEYLEDEGILWSNDSKPTEWQGVKSIGCHKSQMRVRLAEGVLSYPSEDWYRVFSSDRDYDKIHWEERKK